MNFERGQDPKKTLKIGKTALYLKDPCKYLSEDLYTYLHEAKLAPSKESFNPVRMGRLRDSYYLIITVRALDRIEMFKVRGMIKDWIKENTPYVSIRCVSKTGTVWTKFEIIIKVS